MNDKEIKLKVSLDDKQALNQSNKLSKSFGAVSKGLQKGMKLAVVGIGAAATALGGFVAKSVSMAGELEQQIGGAEAVFQDFAKGEWLSVMDGTFQAVTKSGKTNFVSLQDVAKNAFGTMGLSANDYLATINKMGALMQGTGISTEKSMNLSAQAMQRAADVASIMGVDVNFAMESIAGAAKGNFTMMDNLGVAMNATSIEAYALSKGINKSFNEMTKAEQVGMAMEMFLEKSAYATGNYAKENQTFAGSFQTLKSSFANFMSGAGDVDALIASFLSFADILVTKIGEMAPKLVDGFVKMVNAISPKIPEILNKLLPSVINGAVSLIKGFVGALPGFVSALQSALPMLVSGFKSIFTAIIDMLPTLIPVFIQMALQLVIALANALPTMIPQIVDAILGIIPILTNNIPLLISVGMQLLFGLIDGIINAIPSLIDAIPDIIEAMVVGIMSALPVLLAAAPVILIKLGIALIKAIPSLLALIPRIPLAIINGIKQGAAGMATVGTNLIKGLWNGMKNMDKWILDKIKSLGAGIIKKFKGIFGIKSPSVEFAYLGKMNMTGLVEGMDGMEKTVNKKIDKMVDFSPNIEGKYNVAFGGGMSNQVLINMEMPDIIMDGNKVARSVTPFVTKTIKVSGGNV